jgi:hypothetical protein
MEEGFKRKRNILADSVPLLQPGESGVVRDSLI